jgi:predicted  nucleic acid-binding Zn-ribbon protein
LSRDKLKSLEELQTIDLEIRDLAIAAEKHPARLKQIESEKTQAKAALDALRGKMADNERARRQQTEMHGLEQEKVRKWEGRLSELKTPREYAALARELDIAKKTNITADLELKRLSAEYEELKASSAGAEAKLAEKDQVAAREGKEIESLLEGVRKQVAALEKQRAVAVTQVERTLIQKYEKLRKQRGGVAVAAVVNGTCKGCQMNIPPHMANLLRTGREIQFCPSCYRFIYAADPVAPPPGAEA